MQPGAGDEQQLPDNRKRAVDSNSRRQAGKGNMPNRVVLNGPVRIIIVDIVLCFIRSIMNKCSFINQKKLSL
jgi:hypothetical protein